MEERVAEWKKIKKSRGKERTNERPARVENKKWSVEV